MRNHLTSWDAIIILWTTWVNQMWLSSAYNRRRGVFKQPSQVVQAKEEEEEEAWSLQSNMGPNPSIISPLNPFPERWSVIESFIFGGRRKLTNTRSLNGHRDQDDPPPLPYERDENIAWVTMIINVETKFLKSNSIRRVIFTDLNLLNHHHHHHHQNCRVVENVFRCKHNENESRRQINWRPDGLTYCCGRRHSASQGCFWYEKWKNFCKSIPSWRKFASFISKRTFLISSQLHQIMWYTWLNSCWTKEASNKKSSEKEGGSSSNLNHGNYKSPPLRPFLSKDGDQLREISDYVCLSRNTEAWSHSSFKSSHNPQLHCQTPL